MSSDHDRVKDTVSVLKNSLPRNVASRIKADGTMDLSPIRDGRVKPMNEWERRRRVQCDISYPSGAVLRFVVAVFDAIGATESETNAAFIRTAHQTEKFGPNDFLRGFNVRAKETEDGSLAIRVKGKVVDYVKKDSRTELFASIVVREFTEEMADTIVRMMERLSKARPVARRQALQGIQTTFEATSESLQRLGMEENEYLNWPDMRKLMVEKLLAGHVVGVGNTSVTFSNDDQPIYWVSKSPRTQPVTERSVESIVEYMESSEEFKRLKEESKDLSLEEITKRLWPIIDRSF